MGKPERRMGLRVRAEGHASRRAGASGEVRPEDRRSVRMGRAAFGSEGRWRQRVVQTRGGDSGGLEVAALLPRHWSMRLADRRLRERQVRRPPSGRLRSVRGRAYFICEEGRKGDGRTARVGRSVVRGQQGLAALRQAGLRQRARHLADGLPRRTRRKLCRVRALRAFAEVVFREDPHPPRLAGEETARRHAARNPRRRASHRATSRRRSRFRSRT